MADDTIMTLVGYLTADPELRYTPSGAPVSNFTIASTPRFFDRQSSEWKDGETLFMRCSLWREAAENASESLRKGMRVIAQGRLKARSFDTREGERRTAWELDVDEIGPSLRKATAQVQKTTGGAQAAGGFGGSQGGFNSGGDSFGGGWGGQPSGAQAGGGQSDPWGGQPSSGGWDTPSNDEPPF